jgi:hypothetical protein
MEFDQRKPPARLENGADPVRPGSDIRKPEDRTIRAEDNIVALRLARGAFEPIVDIGPLEGGRDARIPRQSGCEGNRFIADVYAGNHRTVVRQAERILTGIALQMHKR